MTWNDYRKAVDALPFSPDFQARTEELLHRRVREASEKENMPMKQRVFPKIAAAMVAVLLLTVSAYAAVKLLSPDEVAGELGRPLLAEAFRSEGAVAVNESVETGDYRITLAGLVSGEGLTGWGNDVDQERTYAVACLERLDGEPLAADLDDQWVPTPLVAGFTPWSVNLWTLDSGVRSINRDGVVYYLVDTMSLEIFADHTVYLAVYQGGTPSRESFVMAEDGTIAFAEGYEGPHALFTLPLDGSKADSAAVDTFIAESGFPREWFTGEPLPVEAAVTEEAPEEPGEESLIAAERP